MNLSLTISTKIEKERLAWLLFMASALVAYFGSLKPWFMWSLGNYYILVAAFFMVSAMVLSMTLRNQVFTSRGHVFPALFFALFMYYVALVVYKVNFAGIVAYLFHVIFFLGICVVNKRYLRDFGDMASKVMAVIVCISAFGFMLYLLGIGLPYVNAQDPDERYTYNNYFFFLLDDRSAWAVIPRFNCVFLEPGHFGVACVHLLLLQCGKWRKWYNMVLIASMLFTFSLEAYVEFFVLIFGTLWVQRERFARKLVLTLLFISVVVTGAFFYRGGDNLFHDLILIRLEVDEGELAGDNRVTVDFDSAYESYLDSSETIFGVKNPVDMKACSGYKVFIYLHGFFGLGLYMLFFFFVCLRYKDWRMMVLAIAIAFLHFIVRSSTWYAYILPIYCAITAYGFDDISTKKKIRVLADNG